MFLWNSDECFKRDVNSKHLMLIALLWNKTNENHAFNQYYEFLFIYLVFWLIFRDVPLNTTNGKVHLSDIIIPPGKCVSNVTSLGWLIVIIALVFWLLRFAYVMYSTFLNWEIRAFYRTALGVADVSFELVNLINSNEKATINKWWEFDLFLILEWTRQPDLVWRSKEAEKGPTRSANVYS